VADANAPKASARNEFVNRGRAKPEAVSYLADAEKALTDSSNNAGEAVCLFRPLQH